MIFQAELVAATLGMECRLNDSVAGEFRFQARRESGYSRRALFGGTRSRLPPEMTQMNWRDPRP